jgi:hypothetical protein
VAEHLADRVKAIPQETYAHLTDRVIPQGASELAHALYSSGSTGYVPYGPHQRAVVSEQSNPQPNPSQTQAHEREM